MSDNPDPGENQVEITLDGKKLGTTPFVQQILSAMVISFLDTLKGPKDNREIVITIRRGR